MAGYRKLSRTASQRKALLRGQVTTLLYNGKIVTTEAKAKEVRKIAEDKIVDMNCFTIESAMLMVAGTARSMGITTTGEAPVKP